MPRIYNYNELSGEWEKSDGTLVGVLSGEGRAVESVNGKTGKVELTAEDVGALSENSVIPATAEMTEPVGIGEDGKLKVKANIKFDILWENSAPKSEFPNQTLNLPDISKYDMIVVFTDKIPVWCNKKSSPNGTYLFASAAFVGGGLLYYNIRAFRPYYNTNSLLVQDCEKVNGSTGSVESINNSALIPEIIYGVLI